jgi:hypothetical protein
VGQGHDASRGDRPAIDRASATPALSITRQATISATSGVGVGAAAASSAIFHVNCACLGNSAELGCTRTSWTTIVAPLSSK